MSGLYNEMIVQFKQVYPDVEPTHLVHVPGRVNLIGEHLDYNGLPVLPMALDREICMVLGKRPGSHKVDFTNISPNFVTRSFQISDDIPPYSTGNWGNYLKAGVQGVVKLAAESGRSLNELNGLAALVDADLPAAAGLSSSSALVVASALATLAGNDISVSRRSLADRMSVAETYVGTMGGGMDHAAILLSDPGAALMIDFFPLRATPVPIPQGYSIVVCNSMVAAPKTAEARRHYNRLPVECKLATMLLRRQVAPQLNAASATVRVADLLTHFSTSQLLEMAEQHLAGIHWGKANTAAALGISVAELDSRFLLMRDGDIMPEPEEGFLLVQRMRHVIAEGQRVHDSVQALHTGDAALFGRLMNESHASCRDHYRISCPELEQLVAIARANGAIGSRLTGAGFGGCCVSLVPACAVANFREAVTAQYYEDYLQRKAPELFAEAVRRGYDNVVLVGHPVGGARVEALKGDCHVLLNADPDIAIA